MKGAVAVLFPNKDLVKISNSFSGLSDWVQNNYLPVH